MPPPQPLTIGKLAQAAGVNVETVRYYQRRGLIPIPPKTLGGQRRYAESALRQIAFIRRGQALGFTLDEIASLLQAATSNDCAASRDLAHRKLEEVRNRVSVLNRMARQLRTLVDRADANRRKTKCPVIDHLNGDAEAD